MKIKVIQRIEKDGQVTGVLNYGTLGGTGVFTVDMATIQSADNFDEFKDELKQLNNRA